MFYEVYFFIKVNDIMLYESFKTKLIVLISCYIMILIEINLSKTYLD